jgi:hypothetical protein
MTRLPRSDVADHPCLTISLSRWPAPTLRRHLPVPVLPAASRSSLVAPSRRCATGSLLPASADTCHPPALVAAALPLARACEAEMAGMTMAFGDLSSVSGYWLGPPIWFDHVP